MPLYLVEIPLGGRGEAEVVEALDAISKALEGDGEIIEAQIGLEAGRAFLVAEAPEAARLEQAVQRAGLEVTQAKEVLLVGAELEEVKAKAGKANYLVEWNLPAGLTMEQYLERKKEKSANYALVPEVSFERTYVCTDMSKCLCFYDSPGEEWVKKAREAVEAPIDSLTSIKQVGA
ncbi:MAG: DUF4242 domain-containing protein [Clostridia bacterium]|nr:DUF4242 domain-containing protein [Bacillota bacterium]MBO2521695.1 DUF4242 domain-containing protein [Bacillota bacterium]